MRLNYPGGCDHIASVRQFGLRFELADAPDGAPHGRRLTTILHQAPGTRPCPVGSIMEPPSLLKGLENV